MTERAIRRGRALTLAFSLVCAPATLSLAGAVGRRDRDPAATARLDVRSALRALRSERAYLDGERGSDARWRAFRAKAADLERTAEAALAGGVAAGPERLEAIAAALRDLRGRIPLRLPSGWPEGPGRFGAYYTKLRYSLRWDAPWRVGPEADVVVRFEDGGHRLVFWRGTNSIPCWVNDAGVWYTDGFVARRGGASGTEGCCEPISDKQTRFSRVRILQSHEARVVIHWRYAPVDVRYRLPYIDELTGWGDWVDEYYTVYPDAVAVRRITLRTSAPDAWSQWQESIVVNQPGTGPEDNIEREAVTLADMGGRTHTYSWATSRPEVFDRPPGANIQLIGLKGERKPFQIVPPEACAIRPYPKRPDGEARFPCWNHWPVSRAPSGTTVASSFDKPSHTWLSHIFWGYHAKDGGTLTKVHLHGLTAGDAAGLVPLARSWLRPAALELLESGYESLGYDRTQGAYVLARSAGAAPRPLDLRLAASERSPVVHPAFLVRRWGSGGATLAIDGLQERGSGCRLGHERGFAGVDLVVWIPVTSARPLRITLSPSAP